MDVSQKTNYYYRDTIINYYPEFKKFMSHLEHLPKFL